MRSECAVCKKIYETELEASFCFFSHEDFMDFFYRLDGSLNDLPALCEMQNVKEKRNNTLSDAAKIFHELTIRCLADLAEDQNIDKKRKMEDIIAEAFILITRLSLITTDEKVMRDVLENKINKLKYDLGMV